jgi:hypothetical protein
MATQATPGDSLQDLARAEAFFAAQLKLPRPERLPESELVKVKDLCDDIMIVAKLGDARTPEKVPLLARALGWIFAAFERIAGLPVPAKMPARHWQRHARPKGAEAAPAQCVTEFHLLDRLSQIYSGSFRGAVVLNCTLGVLASTALLSSLSTPIGLNWLSKWLEDHVGRLPISAIVGLLCLGAVAFIYWLGRTQEEEDDEHTPPATFRQRLGGQRWHQRWLEYRLLAERFRYVDLLLPLGVDPAREVSIASRHDAARMWHQRYLEARTTGTSPPRQSVRQYRDHALAVMVAQEEYHVANHRRRGAIARRLHRIAKWAFFIGTGICILDIAYEAYLAYCAAHPLLTCHDCKSAKATMLFLAALFPILSAATYAVLTHAEYAKVADASGDTFERVHRLHSSLADVDVSDADADADADKDRLARMRPIVVEFVTIAITEATGWRAMLRDKNVPLL